MIPVPLGEYGPDMDMVEQYVNNDDAVKGIWCVPKIFKSNWNYLFR